MGGSGGGGGSSDSSQNLWRSPILLFSRESLSTPLTSLPSSELQAEALKMFKSIQLFMSVPLDTSGIDYHVALAQNALDLCLATPQLRNEFFCQIIKQTSKHSHKQGMQVGSSNIQFIQIQSSNNLTSCSFFPMSISAISTLRNTVTVHVRLERKDDSR